jgi:hypothetical protein
MTIPLPRRRPAWLGRFNVAEGEAMIRIALAMLAMFACSPASADERISNAIKAAAFMYVAGTHGACPNLRLNMQGLIDMLKGDGLEAQDFDVGGRYYSGMQTAMEIDRLRYARDAKLFCNATAAVFANGSTANVLELEK